MQDYQAVTYLLHAVNFSSIRASGVMFSWGGTRIYTWKGRTSGQKPRNFARTNRELFCRVLCVFLWFCPCLPGCGTVAVCNADSQRRSRR